MTLLELRDAIRAATGPSEELSEALAVWLGYEKLPNYSNGWRLPDKSAVQIGFGPPHYTGSLDAAVTLVPEGLWYTACTGRVRADEPLYAVAFNWPDMHSDAPTEVASAEHVANIALCFCLARIEYEIAKEPAR